MSHPLTSLSSLSAFRSRASADGQVEGVGLEPTMRGIALSFPCPRYCGDFAIHISRDGQWFYRGSQIGRKSLCKLFASVLHCDSDGEYWLITPAERGRITVELAPFFVSDFTYDDSLLRLKTTLDEWFTVDRDHPIFMERRCPRASNFSGRCASNSSELLPYLSLGEKKLDALISRNVFYALAEHAECDEEESGLFFIRSGSERFALNSSSFSQSCVSSL